MTASFQAWIDMEPRPFTCGYCGKAVGGRVAAKQVNEHGTDTGNRIYVCPFCHRPTFFEGGVQTPGVAYGNEVSDLPEDLAALYKEARNCMAVGSFTSAVLACRKMLAHIAVDQGADSAMSFMDYVTYLADHGFVPPHGKGWVDHIRKKGNEANHEIVVMERGDAEDLVSFVEMLLKFIYEFPAKVPLP